jgi:ABC-type sugar transport system ATPase subunit
MAGIELRNATKRFGAVTAVDRVDLEIQDGEFFALLGSSGCGKTTTLRMIAGLETPTEGRIFAGGRDVTHLPPGSRDVAMVFQDYALYPHMTVLENVAYPLKVRGIDANAREARAREVASSLQIEPLLGRRPGQLSGGQQQRAAVARAAVHRPQVFLFDEPLSNLDARTRLEARGFLKHLQHELGVTTIYVTHDQAEAMALADRIAVMHQGRVLQVGTPEEIYRRPVDSFVAGFIGSPPMNLLGCRLSAEGRWLEGEGFRLDLTSRAAELMQTFAPGDELLLGIRPEHLAISTTPEPQAIEAQVYAVQPQGPEYLVSFRAGSTPLTVRVFSDEPLPAMDRAWLRPNLGRALFYRTDGSLADERDTRAAGDPAAS